MYQVVLGYRLSKILHSFIDLVFKQSWLKVINQVELKWIRLYSFMNQIDLGCIHSLIKLDKSVLLHESSWLNSLNILELLLHDYERWCKAKAYYNMNQTKQKPTEDINGYSDKMKERKKHVASQTPPPLPSLQSNFKTQNHQKHQQRRRRHHHKHCQSGADTMQECKSTAHFQSTSDGVVLITFIIWWERGNVIGAQKHYVIRSIYSAPTAVIIPLNLKKYY